MKLVNKIFVFFIVMFFSLLTGCQSTVLYHQTEGNIADVKQRSTEALHKSDAAGKPLPSLVVNQGLYVDKTPISIYKDPSWLKNKIVLRGDQLPFSYYSRTVASGGGKNILTRYQVGLDASTKVSINYSGTVRGALDLLAARTGYVYSINGPNIYWQAFITKTFDIAFMPGSSDYMMGKAAAASSGSSASAGGAGGTTVNGMIDDSASSQYSNLKGTLSVWKDLETTIQQLLSADGKVIVSEATTSVTVRDRPTNVDLVSKFVKNLNTSLSKQVLVKVQVLDVSLSSDYVYGINWDIVQRAFGGSNYILKANYGTPISITSLSGGGIPAGGIQKGLDRDPITGTWFQSLINALTQQGKVSIVSEPRVVCLNNQVSAIRIINQEGYLQSIQNTTTSGGASTAAGNTITSQITPGTLVTGLTLYILPKIMDNKIYLQVNADLSNKISIDTISSTTGGAPAPGSNAGVIQVPKLTQKQFNQRSMIGSGDTLILSGFRRISNQANAMQLLDSQTLGGRGASQTNSETIVLITPVILPGYA
jgi:type IVB pilus formation R64 PilN family outer membrane protein